LAVAAEWPPFVLVLVLSIVIDYCSTN